MVDMLGAQCQWTWLGNAVIRQSLMECRLAWNLLSGQGRPWTPDPPSSTSWILGLHSSTVATLLSLSMLRIKPRASCVQGILPSNGLTSPPRILHFIQYFPTAEVIVDSRSFSNRMEDRTMSMWSVGREPWTISLQEHSELRFHFISQLVAQNPGILLSSLLFSSLRV